MINGTKIYHLLYKCNSLLHFYLPFFHPCILRGFTLDKESGGYNICLFNQHKTIHHAKRDQVARRHYPTGCQQ